VCVQRGAVQQIAHIADDRRIVGPERIALQMPHIEIHDPFPILVIVQIELDHRQRRVIVDLPQIHRHEIAKHTHPSPPIKQRQDIRMHD
jgi:hypothetical protein